MTAGDVAYLTAGQARTEALTALNAAGIGATGHPVKVSIWVGMQPLGAAEEMFIEAEVRPADLDEGFVALLRAFPDATACSHDGRKRMRIVCLTGRIVGSEEVGE